jgi:hypothetical protein
LINALVDPDEAARHLPPGLRPHTLDGGTVVGCCLLELEDLRPALAPSATGFTLRAAAHRISAEWAGATETRPEIGVYVPMRHTDSRLAVLAGGRVFPGVHERAQIGLDTSDTAIRWRVDAPDAARFGLRVVASTCAPVSSPSETIGYTCLTATLGLSPGLRGRIEGIRMEPAHREARRVRLESLASNFLDSFVSAQLAPCYLMTDVDVTWAPVGSGSAGSNVLPDGGPAHNMTWRTHVPFRATPRPKTTKPEPPRVRALQVS